MAKLHSFTDTAKFLAVAGAGLAAAAVVGAAMVIELAVAKAVLEPLFREPATHAV